MTLEELAEFMEVPVGVLQARIDFMRKLDAGLLEPSPILPE